MIRNLAHSPMTALHRNSSASEDGTRIPGALSGAARARYRLPHSTAAHACAPSPVAGHWFLIIPHPIRPLCR
jgi:hypothetical protein